MFIMLFTMSNNNVIITCVIGASGPMSFAGLIPGSAPAAVMEVTATTLDDPTGKSHKAKKKKKKNKHKHKHKHKHEKSDRDKESVEKLPETAGGQSSGTSTVNSPMVKTEGPPSSPEFEVM